MCVILTTSQSAMSALRSGELPLTNTHMRAARERDRARDVVGRGAFESRSKQAVDLHSKLVSSVCVLVSDKQQTHC